jgi:mannitol-1-/sugar-/sorbitol-6-phosphatase
MPTRSLAKTDTLTLVLDDGRAGRVELPCRAILFDMDGVLVDSTAVIARRLRAWARGHGLDPAMVLAASHGRTLTDLVSAVAPALDPQAEAAVLAAQEVADAARVLPCPGAEPLTSRLPHDAWAVVTSAYRHVAEARLDAVGIPRPDVLVSASDVRRGKPDPEGYALAAARLGVDPRDCVVVEDAPAGVAAGRAAGCRVVGVAGTVDAAALGSHHLVADLEAVAFS